MTGQWEARTGLIDQSEASLTHAIHPASNSVACNWYKFVFYTKFSQKLFSVMNAGGAAPHRAEIELFRCKMSFEDC